MDWDSWVKNSARIPNMVSIVYYSTIKKHKHAYSEWWDAYIGKIHEYVPFQ